MPLFDKACVFITEVPITKLFARGGGGGGGEQDNGKKRPPPGFLMGG
jgi:hypothetical protein